MIRFLVGVSVWVLASITAFFLLPVAPTVAFWLIVVALAAALVAIPLKGGS